MADIPDLDELSDREIEMLYSSPRLTGKSPLLQKPVFDAKNLTDLTNHKLSRAARSPRFHPDWKYAEMGRAHVILVAMSEDTVIRWVAHGRFTYTAVKTRVGWYTSAPESNEHVDQVMTDLELANLLDGHEFAVAMHWELINVPPF